MCSLFSGISKVKSVEKGSRGCARSSVIAIITFPVDFRPHHFAHTVVIPEDEVAVFEVCKVRESVDFGMPVRAERAAWFISP